MVGQHPGDVILPQCLDILLVIIVVGEGLDDHPSLDAGGD